MLWIALAGHTCGALDVSLGTKVLCLRCGRFGLWYGSVFENGLRKGIRVFKLYLEMLMPRSCRRQKLEHVLGRHPKVLLPIIQFFDLRCSILS